MKLDPSALRYLSKDDFRVLTAVEMGQRNHDIVPTELIVQIAMLRLGGSQKILGTLLRHKLVHHENKHFDGYRLTNLGYDFLALKTFLARGTIAGVGKQIGVGKESDIFVVVDDDENELCMKMHRLGRTSFRSIKNKRDYLRRKSSPSWLYMSRLAATKEQVFMKVLGENGFPVPELKDHNRHALVMNLIDGYPLNQVKHLDDPEPLYIELMELVARFGTHGLIHGDFNEFNIMISDSGKVTVIDFPQMVSFKHPNARMYFERDVNCISRFFRKRFNFKHEMRPSFDEVLANRIKELDVEVAASGFDSQMSEEFESMMPSDWREDQETSKDHDDAESQDEEEGEQLESEEEDVDEEEDDDENSNDSVEEFDDSPDAYLKHDYAEKPTRTQRVDDIRQRVRRDVGRKMQKSKGKPAGSRNRVKNKDRQRVRAEIKES